jgi:hypothetical protein
MAGGLGNQSTFDVGSFLHIFQTLQLDGGASILKQVSLEIS